MARFMLMLHDDPTAFAGKSATEISRIVDEYVAWTQTMQAEGRYVRGDKLKVEPGRIIRRKNGKVLVQDGPYGELGEILAGTMVIEASDYAEACQLAQTSPQLKYNGAIEVREIDEI